MSWWRRRLLVPHVHRRGVDIAWMLILVAALQVGAAVGLAYVAGFSEFPSLVRDLDWPWLGALAGGLAASFVGYFFAYRSIYAVADGPGLDRRHLAVVAVGFGGLFAHGAGALDNAALRAAGASKRDAAVRVLALAGLEQAILGFAGCAASIAVLVLDLPKPAADFTLPWAIIPVPAAAFAFWLAGRYRDRLRDRTGWRCHVGVALDAVWLIRAIVLRPRRYGAGCAGMLLFWMAEAFSVWAALALCRWQMNAAALFIGFATGMIFTRRTAPLAGAGILVLLLPVAIWYSGATLAVSVIAVFTYHLFSLWLPLPFALLSLSQLRTLSPLPLRQAQTRESR